MTIYGAMLPKKIASAYDPDYVSIRKKFKLIEFDDNNKQLQDKIWDIISSGKQKIYTEDASEILIRTRSLKRILNNINDVKNSNEYGDNAIININKFIWNIGKMWKETDDDCDALIMELK